MYASEPNIKVKLLNDGRFQCSFKPTQFNEITVEGNELETIDNKKSGFKINGFFLFDTIQIVGKDHLNLASFKPQTEATFEFTAICRKENAEEKKRRASEIDPNAKKKKL